MDNQLMKYEDQIFGQVTDNITLFTKALAESQNMIVDLKAIAEEKSRVISRLEYENENNKNMIEQISQELKSKCQVIEEFEDDQALMSEMKLNALKLAGLLNDENEKINQLETEKAEYKTAKEVLVSENEKLKCNLDSEKKKYSDLEREHNKSVVDFRNKIEELNKTINEYKLTIDKLKCDKEYLEEENKELNIKVENLNEKINILSDPSQNEKCKDLQDELNNLRKTVNSLQNDINWLKGYAKATDDKVKRFYNGNKTDLDKHNDWLCNQPKDKDFIRFFGNDVPKYETKNDENTAGCEQPEYNVSEQKKFQKTIYKQNADVG